MKFTDLFIRRPVLAIVVNLVILIAGLQSIRSLSVRQYPRSDVSVVTVTTVYVGASADLVRGFITSPLERVIASADGIDYMESSSAQSVSTITVHLKLNYDTNDALTQVQAKVAQVRNDLPPSAQAPVIAVETADSRFAAMYLGFASTELGQNEISDYLTRVVQPRLSAVSWRAARGHPRRALVRDARVARPDAHGRARTVVVAGVERALEKQLPVGTGQHQGFDGVGQPGREYRPEDGRGLPRADRQAGRRPGRPARRRGERRAGGRGLQPGSPVQRRDRDVHGHLGAAHREHAHRDQRRARSGRSAAERAARRHDRRDSLRFDPQYRGRDPRGAQDAHGDAADRRDRHLPVHRLDPRAHHPGDRDPDLTDRCGIPHGDRRLHDQPADAARDRAVGGIGGRRRHCHGGEHRTPRARGAGPVTGRDPRGARAGRADHRDDDHAGCGVHADRAAGRAHGFAVPRVRVHARGRGADLGLRGADAVPDAGVAAAAAGRQRTRLRRAHQSPVRPAACHLLARALRRAAEPPPGARRCG